MTWLVSHKNILYRSLSNRQKSLCSLLMPDAHLRAPSAETLSALRLDTITVRHKDIVCDLPRLVLQGDGASLLSKDWFTPLGISVTGIPISPQVMLPSKHCSTRSVQSSMLIWQQRSPHTHLSKHFDCAGWWLSCISYLFFYHFTSAKCHFFLEFLVVITPKEVAALCEGLRRNIKVDLREFKDLFERDLRNELSEIKVSQSFSNKRYEEMMNILMAALSEAKQVRTENAKLESKLEEPSKLTKTSEIRMS